MGGQRVATLIMYLNDVQGGGSTHAPCTGAARSLPAKSGSRPNGCGSARTRVRRAIWIRRHTPEPVIHTPAMDMIPRGARCVDQETAPAKACPPIGTIRLRVASVCG